MLDAKFAEKAQRAQLTSAIFALLCVLCVQKKKGHKMPERRYGRKSAKETDFINIFLMILFAGSKHRVWKLGDVDGIGMFLCFQAKP